MIGPEFCAWSLHTCTCRETATHWSRSLIAMTYVGYYHNSNNLFPMLPHLFNVTCNYYNIEKLGIILYYRSWDWGYAITLWKYYQVLVLHMLAPSIIIWRNHCFVHVLLLFLCLYMFSLMIVCLLLRAGLDRMTIRTALRLQITS